MEFLELIPEMTTQICEYVKLKDLIAISQTCGDLRWLFPEIEVRQRARFRKVMADIRAIEYIDYSRVNTEGSKRMRIDGTIVTYERDGAERVLWIDYVYPKTVSDPSVCDFDGGYLDQAKFRKFRTLLDKKMWYRRDVEPDMCCISRRRLPGSYVINVAVDRTGHQSITVYDEDLNFGHDITPKHYPDWWTDDKTDN